MNAQLAAIIDQIPTTTTLDKYQPTSFEDDKFGTVFNYNRTLSDGIGQSLATVNRSIAISRQPKAATPWHLHNYIELTFVLRGSAKLYLDNQVLDITTGQLFLIGQQTIHTIKLADKAAIVFNIAITGTFLTQERLAMLQNIRTVAKLLFSILQNTHAQPLTYLKFNAEQQPQIDNTLTELICDYYQPCLGSQALIDLNILKLLVQLVQLRQSQQQATIVNQSSDIFDMLIYIENHFQDLSLTQMAQTFHFHPNYLSAKLKLATGRTFKQLIALQRLNTAANELTYTNLPVATIAERVGYLDTSYFYHEFKRLFGVTPTQYRQNA